jgi:hypothetical protein
VAAPHTAVSCLALPETSANPNVQAYHLLHEFPSDIVPLRVSTTVRGQSIQSSSRLAQLLSENGANAQGRSWIKDSFGLTLGEALLMAASARFLDIEEGANTELGITFRNEIEPCLDNRELIVFDTAPGGVFGSSCGQNGSTRYLGGSWAQIAGVKTLRRIAEAMVKLSSTIADWFWKRNACIGGAEYRTAGSRCQRMEGMRIWPGKRDHPGGSIAVFSSPLNAREG